MRFGIGMNTDHTLEEVGQQFSVTRERIRQIEAKALRKLKHPSLVILALLGSPGPGRSESETTELSKTPVFEGGAVVTATRSEVSADRLPVEVSVLDREEIAASGAHTMDDVLRQSYNFV